MFAMAGAWFKGIGDDKYGIFDDQTMGKGTFDVLGASSHVHDVGRMFGNTGQTLTFPAPSGRYDVVREWSFAICLYLKSAPAAYTRIFKKRLGTSSIGWDMQFGAGSEYLFELDDGPDSTCGTYVPTAGLRDIIVGTYDGATMRMYANGILNDTVAFAKTGSFNNTEPLIVFPAADTVFDVAMFALWNRELTATEAGKLWADPYLMWRNRRRNEFLSAGLPPVPPSDLINDCCCPCCGGLVHFGL